MAQNFSNLVEPKSPTNALQSMIANTSTPSTGTLSYVAPKNGVSPLVSKYPVTGYSAGGATKPLSSAVPQSSAPKASGAGIASQSNGLYKATGINAGINPYTVGQTQQPASQPVQQSQGSATQSSNPADSTAFNLNMQANQASAPKPVDSTVTPATANSLASTTATNPTSSGGGLYGAVNPGYSSLVGQLANQGNSPYNQALQQSVQGLNNTGATNASLGQSAQQIADSAANQYQRIGQLGANALAGDLTTGTSPVASGNAAIQAQNTAALQANAINGANLELQGNNQAIAAQGQTQSGLNSAGGLASSGQNAVQNALGTAAGYAAPVTQFGQLTNPVTGQVIGAGATGNNPMLDSAVQNTLKLIQNGATQEDAIRTSGLGNFGAAGQTALASSLLGNGSYNPTTQSATASQNASQAVSAQNQAFNLDTGLKNLDNISTTATNFLTSSGILNPTQNPNYNAAIGTYIANVKNPADALTYQSILADLNSFKSQVLSSSNQETPTALTSLVSSTDPSKLSAPQLVTYLSNLSTLGKQQLSVLQSQVKNSSGSNPYAGAPTSVNTNLQTSPNSNNSISGDQVKQVIGGSAINLVGGVEDLFHKVTGLAASLF